MLNDFIFSLNSALPIFVVLFGGFLLKRHGIIDEAFIKQANRLVFYVALPIKLVTDVGKTSFSGGFDIAFIAFIVLGTLISIPICALVASLVVQDDRQKGAFIQGAFRGNFLYVGYSLLENVTGQVGTRAPIAFAFIVPLYNILGIMILAYYSETGDHKVDYRAMFKSIATNPLILSILAGVIFSLSGLKLPTLVDRSAAYFSVMVTPLALLMIGASFRPEKIKANFRIAFLAAILKLVVLPALAVLTASWLGFDHEALLVIYIVFGVPTATVSYIITRIMSGDHDLASSIIMLTTLLSNVTMTLFIFAFKTLGYI